MRTSAEWAEFPEELATIDKADLLRRASEYATRTALTIGAELGAYLDQGAEFSDDVMADWRTEKEEQFGIRWPEVQAILRELESYGVFMLDVNPGNVSFDD